MSRLRTHRQPLVSIVILCHNDGKYLRGCIKSLRRHTDPKRTPYELIIVNNATRDGSEGYLRQLARTPGTRLIENKRNRYFSGGNNQGIRVSRGKHVLLLNADTLVGPGWLERLVACIEREPSIGLVGPYTNGAVGHQWIREPRYDSAERVSRFAKSWGEKHDGEWREVHRVIGFCLLIKREALRAVGLLDERFGPGGYEDYDYCIRVRHAGFKVALAEDVFVHHFGGRGYVGMDYDRLRSANRAILARKWCDFVIEALDDLDSLLSR
jgi:GT2 family glycosyltransferase